MTTPVTMARAAAGSPSGGSGGGTGGERADRADRTGPATEIAALEQQLAQFFATAGTLMRDRAQAVHADLSPGAYKVLTTLVRSGPQHAGTLAAALYVDKSVISRITKQLTEFELVERRPDPDDGRAFYLAATPDAVRRVDAVRAEYRDQLHGFLAEWDPADIQQLADLLGRLNRAGSS